MYSSRATIDSPYLRTQIAVVAAVGQRLKSAVVAGRNHHHFQMRFCQTLQGGISKEWYQGRSGLKNSTRFCSSEEKNRRRPRWLEIRSESVSPPRPHTHTHTDSTMQQQHNVVPNIPGIPVKDDTWLKEKVADLLNMKKYRLIGIHSTDE